MRPEFWRNRWATGQIGFHQTHVARCLEDHWADVAGRRDCRVFVPLCGKSLDLIWLRGRDHEVIGVELSETAIEAFCAENGIPARRRPGPRFDVYEAARLRLIRGDLFELAPDLLPGITAIYDRAALISFMPSLRPAYAQHMTAISPPGTRTLLVTLEYPLNQMQGPPFSVERLEIERLYSAGHHIEELARRDILASEPRLRAKGVSSLSEVCYRLIRRDLRPAAAPTSRPRSSHAAPAPMTFTAALSAQSAELTIDRLFDAPALAGPAIVGLKISPDGTRVAYLQARADEHDRLDLWEYNIADAKARIVVDSAALSPTPTLLSDEELGRRERQRTGALSGILEYSFAPSGKAVLFPLDGRLFYHDFTKPPQDAVTTIAHSPGFVTDAKVSPGGALVAYIKDENLYTYDLATRMEKAGTNDGRGPLKNGMAEFVAQEEMNRSTGYWWSPDDARIAFAQVDETHVNISQRIEIAADDVAIVPQRYPIAGGKNAVVRLGVLDVGGGGTVWIDLGPDTDIYLARVDWLPDGKTLAIQRQSRDQRVLDLLFAEVETGSVRLILTETSDSWMELHDELTFLEQTPEFIWASMRDGYQHLYLYDYAGRLVRRLTAGDWCVEDFRARAIKAVDEAQRLIYFTATEKSPTQRHLYSTSLDTKAPHRVRRISVEDGVHDIVMACQGRFYADTFSNTSQPPQVTLRGADGSLLAYLIENPLDERHPDHPYLRDNAVPEFGTLAAADGQLLHYRLFRPLHFDPQKRYPAVVDVYGGPGVQRVLNDWTGSSFTQILTRSGHVVFQLDNRGSAFRGTAFQAPIHGRLGAAEVDDQVAGARWLASQSFVDAARIGVWGWSYGGYMTLMLMFKAPDVFRAGAAGAPVTDWTLYDTHYTERYLKRPEDNAAGYEASSALRHANDLRGDLLVIHGMADDNVLFVNSARLFRKLQDSGIPFEVMVYPGAKHGLLRQHDGRHAYATILRFFREKLRE